jgi:methylated-DNA-protein-cysteine methyltransferase-like protein
MSSRGAAGHQRADRAGRARGKTAVRASLQRHVHALVRRVPKGCVVTYGQVAALVGAPRAARAVGQAMRVCPSGVPWYRVVNGRGTISRRGDGSGALSQRLLLEGEGVRFVRGRIDLRRYGWRTGARAGPARRFRPELLA